MRHIIRWLGPLTLLLVLLSICSGCSISVGTNTGSNQSNSNTGNSGNTAPSGSSNAAEPNWGHVTKTSGCHAQGGLQDKACTPGDIFPTATKSKICVSGYSKSVRNVSVSTKNQVYAAYGIKSRKAGQYEIDHLVSLQLGGSNDVSNLWPEIATPKPGFHEKDVVENYLHAQVCDGKISLKDAQIQIATNWLTIYNKVKNPSNYSGDSE